MFCFFFVHRRCEVGPCTHIYTVSLVWFWSVFFLAHKKRRVGNTAKTLSFSHHSSSHPSLNPSLNAFCTDSPTPATASFNPSTGEAGSWSSGGIS